MIFALAFWGLGSCPEWDWDWDWGLGTYKNYVADTVIILSCTTQST